MAVSDTLSKRDCVPVALRETPNSIVRGCPAKGARVLGKYVLEYSCQEVVKVGSTEVVGGITVPPARRLSSIGVAPPDRALDCIERVYIKVLLTVPRGASETISPPAGLPQFPPLAK
jgi:hypothetical protein